MAVRFQETDVRPMGRAARGVRGANLRKGDYVVSVCAVSQEGNEKILSVSEKGFGKQTQVNSYRLTKRGGIGVINMKTTEKTGKVVSAFPVEDDSEIMKNFAAKVKRDNIELAVIAVPASSAQAALDEVVKAGIRAVMNFAPVALRTAKDIKLKTVDLTTSLESLSYFLAQPVKSNSSNRKRKTGDRRNSSINKK